MSNGIHSNLKHTVKHRKNVFMFLFCPMDPVKHAFICGAPFLIIKNKKINSNADKPEVSVAQSDSFIMLHDLY